MPADCRVVEVHDLRAASMARRVAGTALAVGALLFVIRLPTGQGLVASFVCALGVMVAETTSPQGSTRRPRS